VSGRAIVVDDENPGHRTLRLFDALVDVFLDVFFDARFDALLGAFFDTGRRAVDRAVRRGGSTKPALTNA
jgi:hypothetical protein